MTDDRITGPFERPETPSQRVSSWWSWLVEPWSRRRDEFEIRILSRLNHLENHMAATDDLIARFDAALNELASDLTALRDDVAGADAAIAAKFEPLIARAEQLGADPADPIPAPEPEPAPESTPELEVPAEPVSDGEQPQ